MLDFARALELARPLRMVKGFPLDQESVDAAAEDLIDLTLPETPDESAKRALWLVTEIRRTWDEWTGSRDMIRLYSARYPENRRIKTEDNEAKNYGEKPAIVCKNCNDTGVHRPGSDQPYVWCECETGITTHFDLPDWIEILNGGVGLAKETLKLRLREIKDAEEALVRIAQERNKIPVTIETERSIAHNPDCPACHMHRHHLKQEYFDNHTTQDVAQ